jgi:hypothetical protein
MVPPWACTIRLAVIGGRATNQSADTNACQGQLESEHRRRAREEHERGHPGLDAHHVELTVEEQGPRTPLGQVHGHEAHDGLIGIEVRLFVLEKDPGTKDNQRRRGQDGRPDGAR